MLKFIFVCASALIMLSLASQKCEPKAGEKKQKERAPFRILYSNDNTNIGTISPFHKPGEPLQIEMLEAAVDETVGSGVDVHMLQPGYCWIPWWKSKTYPAEQHYRWFKDRAGLSPSFYGNYVMTGGDMVQVFVDRCRHRGLTPFISFRLNDGHLLENVGTKNQRAEWVSRFYEEHPEYRIGPDINNWDQRVHNWAIPEVRAHKFAFIREICENYDIDGFELDFMRHPSYFRLTETTSEQRAEIMTAFVAQVRDLLDRTSRHDGRRWLCVRVPCYLAAHDKLGIDLRAMVDAGLDMVNLSCHNFVSQHGDLAAIRKMVPDAALYLEMTHMVSAGPRVSGERYGSAQYRRTTDEQFYTTAHLAYARGIDGASIFNFAYYRQFGEPGRGPFNEPPFHVLNHLNDPSWLARQPQHYFTGNIWYAASLPTHRIPHRMVPGQWAVFTMDMAPPEGGWQDDGRFRIQAEAPLGNSKWLMKFNGVDLKPTTDTSEPYPSPHPPMLGTPEELRAWTVPVGLLKDGNNKVEIGMVDGEPTRIIFIDLAVE